MGFVVCSNHDPGAITATTPRGETLPYLYAYMSRYVQTSSCELQVTEL